MYTEDQCQLCKRNEATLATPRVVIVDQADTASVKLSTATVTVIVPVCVDCYQHDVDWSCQQAATQHVSSTVNTSELTHRQYEVFRCLISGWTSAETSSALGINTKTYDSHRLSALTTLQLRNNVEATLYAMSHNITPRNQKPVTESIRQRYAKRKGGKKS